VKADAKSVKAEAKSKVMHSQGKRGQRSPANHQKPGDRPGTHSSLWLLEGSNLADTLVLNLCPPELRRSISMFKPEFVELCCRSPGKSVQFVHCHPASERRKLRSKRSGNLQATLNQEFGVGVRCLIQESTFSMYT
jgi:hypothetical protein